MLKKDEYNQEEYNDYYRQEVEGAELHGSSNDEGGGKGKLIGLLILIALAVAGYFGYKMSKSDDSIDTSLQVSMDNLPQSVQSETQKDDEVPETEQKSNENTQAEKTESTEETQVEVKKEEVQKEETIQNEVSSKVQQVVASSESKMSPEEVAAIVSKVMKQINEEKSSSDETTPPVTKQDKELINELSTTEVDSVSSDLESALENININEDTHIDNNKKKIDVYNKVTIQDNKGTDTLSQLSAQISNEIEEAKVSSTVINTNKEYKEYSTEIEKEVVSRKKEMRIIVVRKGDTLGKIAKRAYGNVMEFKRIYKANPEITRPDRIYVGQKIRIPLD